MWFLLVWFQGCGNNADGGDSRGGSALCNVDADGDGFGTTTTVASSSCTDEGAADNANDCDDEAASIHPGATETAADGIDQDCDGNDVCFEDLDGDGYGAVRRLARDCATEGLVGVDGDCNDGDAAINPGVQEAPADGVDQDCDGGEACFADIDGDGFGGTALVLASDLDCTDPGEALDDGDCLDSDVRDAAFTFPGAAPNDSDVECMTDADEDDYGALAPAAGVTRGTDRCDDDGTTTCIVHVGYDVQFPDGGLYSPDYLLGIALVVPTDMTLTDLALIGKAAKGNARMALYTDSGGAPDALMAETPSTALRVGVLEMPVKSVVLPAGTYWLMAVYDATTEIAADVFAYSEIIQYRSLAFTDPMPSTFGVAKTYMGDPVNYYIVGY